MTVVFDHCRAERIGLPESVFSEGKPYEALEKLACEYASPDARPVLFTRLAPETYERFPPEVAKGLDYHPLSRTAFNRVCPGRSGGRVAVVSAGTSDGPTAWEAARTLAYLGVEHTLYEDSGVAGLWRLTSRLEEINAHQAVIVVAGMDAALASVLGGLTPLPVIAVPTPVGYGVAQGGETALHSMLASCAPGVAVMNIGNGYGAACAAARIMRLL
ncbi:nickel pincer cofactor biosynthesis protein LarB [Fundidesulfovibrio terrae]|uniref:nickel pincer cofactor biosynthesis protein LarB n=1 Tax=Fundidesulfovibrio terrae TaxID=2922866 RepID=UPI001FAE7EF1|nr:nickel pincer cofactor biosynthesis protein LarB [Fundidesulfovibrio terrae]